MIELHLFGYSHRFQRIEDECLLIGWERTVATASLKVRVAAPVIDANRHEAVVLVGEHAFLELGESTGVGYWLAVAIETARLVLTAFGGIYQTQIFFLLHQSGVCHLMQASSCHKAAAMLAYRIVAW